MNCEGNITADFSELFYELKFFGIFLSEIKVVVKESLDDTIDETYDEFRLQLKYDKVLLNSAFKAMADIYKKSVENHSPELHALIKKTIGIKPYILHPDDAIYRGEFTVADEGELTKRLEASRCRYFALKGLKKKYLGLIEQAGDYEETSHDLNKLLDKISSLKHQLDH